MKFELIGPVISEGKMFENVDGRQTPDAGVTGILLDHLGAFRSGELKMHLKMSSAEVVCCN